MIKSILLYVSYAILFMTFIIISFINLAPQLGSNPSSVQNSYYESLANYNEGEFKNLEETPMMTGEISTWEFFKNDSTRKPETKIIPRKINHDDFIKNDQNDYKLAWLGHSAFILNLSEKIILLDPMLGSHAAPIPLPSLKRFNKTLPIQLDSIKKIDFVLISHDHYDHLDHSTIKLIKNKVTMFIVPHGIGSHLRKWGVKNENIVELNWNESYKIQQLQFSCLPARHFSGRGPLNRNSTLWSSWAIESPSIKIYFSGDSGYGKHFKQIGDEYGPFDISLIDCGQYNSAWKYSHMFPSEAVIAAQDLRTQIFLPIHWGVFTLAMHPWDEPPKESIRSAEEIGLRYFIPEIGEVLSKEIFSSQPIPWWEQY